MSIKPKELEQEPIKKAWQELTLACQRVASPDQSIELRDALDRFADAVSEYDARPLTLDYIQGHKDVCEWSARLATANDPRTGDWLYDDPYELAKALRKGPEFPPVPTAQHKEPEQEPVAQLNKDPDTGKLYVQWTLPWALLADGTKFYTTPPQRKPLTNKEIDSFREANSEGRGAGWRFNFKGFARAIEAAHGINE